MRDRKRVLLKITLLFKTADDPHGALTFWENQRIYLIYLLN
jgi:hypothetical protein